jgi:hypothetical protein
MNILGLDDQAAMDLATDEIHQRPILVQFPTIFVLMATASDAQQLEATKTRLAGKNYGTAIGSLAKFVAQANAELLPDDFTAVRNSRH